MPLWTDRGHGYVKAQHARADNPADAFLCCPGPSLANVPDIRGPGRIVYALNTAYPKIKPDVWIGMDRTACFDRALWREAFVKIARKVEGDTERMRECPNTFFVDLEEADPASMFCRRDNESKFIWQRNSLTVALHFMVWSGHKRIHLVGCDLGGAKDYYDERVLEPEQHASNRRLYASQLEMIERLVPLAKRNGVEFVNCTPGSPLSRCMPEVLLEDAIANCEGSKPQARPVLHSTDADDLAEGKVISKVVDRNVVLVLKSGGEFQPWHVSRLVQQLPGCDVTVLSDFNSCHFASQVKVIPLKYNWPGWWSKMELFRPDLFRDRPFLYMDLDTTVRDLPDAFFTPPSSVMLAPFTKEEDQERVFTYFQSGLMLLHPREREQIWEHWRKDPAQFMREHRGDQDFLSSCGVRWRAWQEEIPNAAASYKQNVLAGRGYNGKPLDEAEIKVLCYHGAPRPWEVKA